MSEFKPINPEALQDNPFSLIGKGWMLITAGRDKCNAMTASWGGLGVMWSKNVAFVVVRPQRYTKEFLDAEPAFSLSFLGDEHRKALSYLGSVSGRNEDKMARCGLTPARPENTPHHRSAAAPAIPLAPPPRAKLFLRRSPHHRPTTAGNHRPHPEP